MGKRGIKSSYKTRKQSGGKKGGGGVWEGHRQQESEKVLANDKESERAREKGSKK